MKQIVITQTASFLRKSVNINTLLIKFFLTLETSIMQGDKEVLHRVDVI